MPAGVTAAVRVDHGMADDGEPATRAFTIAPAQTGALHRWVESAGAPSSDPAARFASASFGAARTRLADRPVPPPRAR
jgi:hypothetical protein